MKELKSIFIIFILLNLNFSFQANDTLDEFLKSWIKTKQSVRKTLKLPRKRREFDLDTLETLAKKKLKRLTTK